MDAIGYEPGPVDGSLLTQQHLHRSQLIWDGEDVADFRLRGNFNQYWVTVGHSPPAPDVMQAIRDAGFAGVYQIGAFRHDVGLITAFIERWRPETHTFHFRFGEATITLEDVHHILGIRTTGLPVLQSEVISNLEVKRDIVTQLLGLYPSPRDVVNSSGIKIPWLVEHFGDCSRLIECSEDYDVQLIFHIRAHLLLVIGSMFPSSSGNRVQFHLLTLLRDLTRIGSFSWGSAVLAYLYRKLCAASIGKRADFCGCSTLLQVWIYERFPSLAPAITEKALFQHPLALRWKVRLNRTAVPHSQTRIFRYELDMMTADRFIWMPYADLPHTCMPGLDVERLWTARCPLLFASYVEWCYIDRVTRQFGFVQSVPHASPDECHDRLHQNSINESVDWVTTREPYIRLWNTRMSHTLKSPMYAVGIGCTADYDGWYDTVTRRFIIHPDHWATEAGFQGTLGVYRFYHEGIFAARDAIRTTEPHLHDVQRVLGECITSTKVPAASRRGSRRHVASGRSRGRPRNAMAELDAGTTYGHVLGATSHLHKHTGSELMRDREGILQKAERDPQVQSTTQDSQGNSQGRCGDSHARDFQDFSHFHSQAASGSEKEQKVESKGHQSGFKHISCNHAGQPEGSPVQDNFREQLNKRSIEESCDSITFELQSLRLEDRISDSITSELQSLRLEDRIRRLEDILNEIKRVKLYGTFVGKLEM